MRKIRTPCLECTGEGAGLRMRLRQLLECKGGAQRRRLFIGREAIVIVSIVPGEECRSSSQPHHEHVAKASTWYIQRVGLRSTLEMGWLETGDPKPTWSSWTNGISTCRIPGG
jgi:hypothetical protein